MNWEQTDRVRTETANDSSSKGASGDSIRFPPPRGGGASSPAGAGGAAGRRSRMMQTKPRLGPQAPLLQGGGNGPVLSRSHSSRGSRRGAEGCILLPPEVRRHGKHEVAKGQKRESSSSDGGAPLVREDGLGPSVLEPCGVPSQAGQCGFLVGSSPSTGWAWPPRSPPLEQGPALPTLPSVAPAEPGQGGDRHIGKTLSVTPPRPWLQTQVGSGQGKPLPPLLHAALSRHFLSCSDRFCIPGPGQE